MVIAARDGACFAVWCFHRLKWKNEIGEGEMERLGALAEAGVLCGEEVVGIGGLKAAIIYSENGGVREMRKLDARPLGHAEGKCCFPRRSQANNNEQSRITRLPGAC